MCFTKFRTITENDAGWNDIMKYYDIVICGAGIAGVAAALAGARHGKKVLIVEKQTVVGGLATSGLIYVYLPISDDREKVIASGITRELLFAAQNYGPFAVSEKWGGIPGGDPGINKCGRFCCCFSPAGYALTLEKLLRDAGVDVYLDTTLTKVKCDSDMRLTEVELFCGAESWLVSAGCFIDASGGAFMLRMAGAKVFSEINYVTPRVIEANPDRCNDTNWYFSGNIYMNSIKNIGCGEKIDSLLSVDAMQKFIRSQYQGIREYFDSFVPDKQKSCYPINIPAMPQTRKIARIDGEKLIKDGDGGVFAADSIGVAADWRSPTCPAWETPYGALIPKDVRGALAAGRCINSSGDAWEVFRVIPAAAMTGEAAGTAAAMACEKGIDPRDIPVMELQDELLKNDAILHIADGR